jgi:hypothetical protein
MSAFTPVARTTVAVTGSLTDAELRATAVPISGPLTDAALRATPVPISGPLTDTELRASSVANIPHEHQKVHEGRYFSGGVYNAALADTTSIEILIQTGAQSFHAKLESSASGDSLVYIFEGTTFSAAGTAVVMTNHNRSSAKVFDGTVTHTPTLSTDGTQLSITGYLAAGTKHAGGGGDFGFSNEFILAPNTDYLLRVTNISGGVIKIATSVEGYLPTL